MLVLRDADHRRMPWKNGGGETVKVMVHPRGAGLADFGWRVSMATVAGDGPFSVFPGIDRTLAILEGEGMALEIAGRAAVVLTQMSEPLAFPADAAATARLVSGTITDLNVMTRRGRFAHGVERLAVDGPYRIHAGRGVTLLLSLGNLHVETDRETADLGRLDAVTLEGNDGDIRITAGGR